MIELEAAWTDLKTYVGHNKEGTLIFLPVFVGLTIWAISDGLGFFTALLVAIFFTPLVVLPMAFIGGLIYRFCEVTYEFVSTRKDY